MQQLCDVLAQRGCAQGADLLRGGLGWVVDEEGVTTGVSESCRGKVK